MRASRREFLALAAGGVTGAAFGFPVPWQPAVPSTALRPPSDLLPPLPDGAIRRFGTRRLRTGRGISRIQFSPHGKVLVAADSNEIRGWDVATATPVFAIPYPSQSLNSGRVTNRDAIVVFGRNETTQKYDIMHLAFASGKAEQSVATSLAQIDSAAFSADGSRVAAICNNRLVMLDGREPRELWSREAGSPNRSTVTLLFADADKLLIVGAAESLRIFEVDSGKERDALKYEKAGDKKGRTALTSVVASPDGRYVAGLAGETVPVWNVTRGELIQTVPDRKDARSPLGFTPDGRELFILGEQGVAAVDVASGKTLRTLDIGVSREPQLCPDGTLLAISSNDAVIFYDAATGQPHVHCADPPGLPSTLQFAGPDKLVGLLRDYGGWIEWDLATGTSRLLRPKTVGDGHPVGLARDGRIAVVWNKKSLHRWNLADGSEKPALAYEANRSAPVAAVAGGDKIVAAADGGLKVWDVETGAAVAIAADHKGRDEADSLAVAADGDTVALIAPVLTQRQFVEIYSLRAGRLLHRLRADGQLSGITLSADGSRLAASFSDAGFEPGFRIGRGGEYTLRQQLAVYDTRSGELTVRLPALPNEARHHAFSPDNRLLAVAANDRLDIFELASATKRLSHKLPGDATALAFTPDGKAIAVASTGGPLIVWDVRGLTRPKLAKPDAGVCGKLLEWLAGDDPDAAFEALRLTAAWPAETLPLLAKAVPAVPTPDAVKLKSDIEDLNAPAFADREKATRTLSDLGSLAAPALRTALAETGSEEARERIGVLLAACAGTNPADLKIVRAVEAAEWSATSEAKKLLRVWSAGAPGARLTVEAAAAIRRLGG